MKRFIFIYIIIIAAMTISSCAPAPAPAPAVEVIWYVRSNELEQKWENQTIIANFEQKFLNIQNNPIVGEALYPITMNRAKAADVLPEAKIKLDAALQ